MAQSVSSTQSIPPARIQDFELDADYLGPSARMITLETDREGGIHYQIGRREPRLLRLPAGYASRRIVVIDLIQLVALLDPRSHALVAVVSLTASGTNTALLGADWGKWVDENGRLHVSPSMPEQFTRWHSPIALDPGRHLLAFDFLINIHNPDTFPRDLKLLFREGQLHHTLWLRHKFPSGAFHSGQLQIRDARTDRVRSIHDLTDFPLRLPEFTANSAQRPQPASDRMAAGSPSSGPPQTESEDLIAAALRRRRVQNGTANGGMSAQPGSPAGTSADLQTPRIEVNPASLDPALIPPALRPSTTPAVAPRQRPIPKTDHLTTHEMLAVVSTETQPDRRWKMIELNLMLGRAERAYPLILKYADLIAERTSDWPAPRLRVAFVNQPGSVLIAIMHAWFNNQVLAVAEDNAESSRILEWLAEREIERLLALKIEREPASIQEARRLLHVDKNADATAVKKVWRTLLGFMNADHGRSQERAIHRRKDEIAKHLQSARNLLMKNG